MVRDLTLRQVADLTDLAARQWVEFLERDDVAALRTRPHPRVWSPTEYAAHVRDVGRVFLPRLDLMLAEDTPTFANWDQDAAAIEGGYATLDPRRLAPAVALSLGAFAARLRSVALGDGVRRLGWGPAAGDGDVLISVGGFLAVDLVATLLPVLGRPSDIGFNVFDVMHHGLHEKQISNVFRWLLDAGGTHNLGDRFAKIFIDELNHVMVRGEPLPHDGYLVRQEVNTSPDGIGGDIADLVLASNTAVIVIENYFTSDGHGHSYNGYLEYSQREGRRGMVVLLCRDEDRSLQTKGWENAPVVTYGQLVHRLHDELSRDRTYQRKNPEAFSFVDQMHRKFVKGRGRMVGHGPVKGTRLVLEVAVERGVGCVDQLAHECLRPDGDYRLQRHGSKRQEH